MKNLDENYYNPAFSHIYVEQSVMEHPRTRKILGMFPRAQCIEINHYKDVFCRRKQSFTAQHRFPSLILAAKRGTLVYEGAPVCQSFGNEYFYYTSCVMNCLYDCEYCYLQGMYLSGNIVIFVNLEDIFCELEDILKLHPVYLCVSYDTDLMALENITGFVREWVAFAGKHRNLRIEIRTKCGRKDLWEHLPPHKEVIYAFTLSPEKIIMQYEHRTSTLPERIACVAAAQKKEFPVRLCFDPMIYCRDWKEQYTRMLNMVFNEIDMTRVLDVSIGSFRISKDYLKIMRKERPDSAVIHYPFQNESGVCHYPKNLMEEMEQFLAERLQDVIGREKIFFWEQNMADGKEENKV